MKNFIRPQGQKVLIKNYDNFIKKAHKFGLFHINQIKGYRYSAYTFESCAHGFATYGHFDGLGSISDWAK